MDNINERLLGLSGQKEIPDQEQQILAAKGLNRERAAARQGGDLPEVDSENENTEGGTPNQVRKRALDLLNKNKSEAGPAVVSGEGASGLTAATGRFLKQAWLNFPDNIIISLAYINIHVFGRSVLGEKVFCDLGEEWLPPHLRTSLNSPRARELIKKYGLIEAIVLVFLDLLAFLCFLFLIAGIIMIVDFMSKNWWEKAGTLLKLGWDGLEALVNLF